MIRTLAIMLAVLALAHFSFAGENSSDNREFLKNKAAEIKGQVSPPATPSNTPPPKCGTSVMLSIFNYLQKQWDAELASILQRPENLPYSLGSAHFLIHYATSGPDSVYHPGEDINPADGVPDYVNGVAEILENVWYVEIDSLGYIWPIADFGKGGDDRYDIYLRDLGLGYFGLTYPESLVQGYRASAYSELENDFSSSSRYRLNPLDGARVTAAHEFFHAIQFAYDVFEYEGFDDLNPNNDKPWWMESSSTWMEDVVYDDVNDYIGYLTYFYKLPWMSLTTFASGGDRLFHPYASCVWPIFLSEKYEDAGIVREIWEECGLIMGYNTLPATDFVLQAEPRRSSLEAAFLEFEVWNFHTGPMADTSRFFSEGNRFPAVDTTFFIRALDTLSTVDISDPLEPPEDMAANFIVIRPGSVPGGVHVDFNGEDIVGSLGWHVAVLGYLHEGSLWIEMPVDPRSGVGVGGWYNWDSYSAVVVIPTVSGIAASDTSTHRYAGSVSFDPALILDYDVGGVAFLSPAGGGRKGEAITPVVRYVNTGRQTANFDIRLTIDHNGQVYDEIVGVTNLLPSEVFDADFPEFVPDDVGRYNLVAASDLLGDQLTVNDTIQERYYSFGAVGPLLSAYPSPFVIESDADFLTIPFSFDPADFGTKGAMRIYDSGGQLVRELPIARVRTSLPGAQAFYGFTWDGRNDDQKYVASGIYVYLLESGSATSTGKIAVINKRR